METPRDIQLLIIEDNAEICASVQFLLEDTGYQVDCAATIPEALIFLQDRTYNLILTDLFSLTDQDSFASIVPITDAAYPTPVAVMTAHTLPSDLNTSTYAFVLAKPFDIDDLLAHIAAALHTPLNPDSDEYAALLMRYFAALSAHDFQQAADLCSEDVVYLPSPSSLLPDPLWGREAFRDFVHDATTGLIQWFLDHVLIYPTPKGRAVRYTNHWQLPEGPLQEASGVGIYQFTDQHISQIGIRSSTFVLSKQTHEPANEDVATSAS